jgi:chromosome segregation ATPase
MNIDNATLEFEQVRLKCKTEKSQLTTLVAQHDELLREISNRSELHEQQTRRCDDLKSQEQSLVMKLAQVKEKIQVFQEQEKIYSEKRAQWEAMDANYSKKSIEMDNLVHALNNNRAQLAAITKELEDYQSQIGLKQVALDKVLSELNQAKLQFASESGRQKELIADLASDLQTKQTALQQTNATLQSTNEKLARAQDAFADLSERVTEAEESLTMIDSKKSSVQEAKEEIEKSISELSKTCSELDARRIETLAAIEVLAEQREVAQAESFDFVQSHLNLKATEATLLQGCQQLEEELQAKRDQLTQTTMQISAGEQQVFETLQAITLIGQQREGAMSRLESDREALDQARKGLEILQIQKLDCESSVLHFQSEVARMVVSRDRLAEDLRALEAQRKAALEAALSTPVAAELTADREEAVVTEPDTLSSVGETRAPEMMIDELEMLANEFANSADSSSNNSIGVVTYADEDAEYRSNEISLEENIIADLELVMQSVEEANIRAENERDDCIEDDAWGDLLRVVRVA